MKSMRKLIGLLAAAAVLTGLFLPAAAQPAERQKIRVGYFTFSSFQNVDADGNYSGYGYEYLQEIAGYAGWEYEYVVDTWENCLRLLAEGKLDLLGSAQKTPEREALYDFAEMDSGISYAVLCASSENKDLAYEDVAAFDGMLVGLLAGNSRNGRLKEYCAEKGFTVKTRMYSAQEELRSALQSGEVDAILTSNLRKEKGERIVARFAPSPFYFMTAKGNQAVLDQLNYAQNQIKLINPHYDAELYEKYYGAETTEKPVFTRAERTYIQNAPALRAIYYPNEAPISNKNLQTGEFEGIDASIFAQLAQDTGLVFTFIPESDPEKAASMLQNGEADLICGFTEDYALAAKSGLIMTNSYFSMPNVMLTGGPVNAQNARTAALMKNFPSSFQKELERKGLKLTYYPDARRCVEAVLEGKAGAAFMNAYSANLLLTDSRYFHLNVSTIPNLTGSCCIALPRDADPHLLTIFNKAIQFLSAEIIEQVVLENTITERPAMARDLIYQRPVTVILICSAFFAAIITLLVYIFFLKNHSDRKIKKLLYMDDLTGIWNYSKFRIEAEKLLQSNLPYALVYTDIERFKYFNDVNGYATGDMVLRTIAKRLVEATEPEELFARISADNFVSLLKYNERDAFIARLRRFNEQINSIRKNERESFKITLTSGVYIIQPEDKEISNVIDCANEARKTIKGSHKSGLAFYDERLRRGLAIEREIVETMESALQNGQFIPYYQPKFDIATAHIVGAEALARWLHPERGLIPPMQFIPVFERNGFVIDLDFYIYERVCEDLRRRLDAGLPVVRISSNFSRRHLHRPDFVSRLLQIAERWKVPASLLELEITESAAQENADFMLPLLQSLQQAGFSIAMDDFGTGYSSLNLLKQLPVDTLKLDKEFLQKGFADQKERIVIEGFVSIADKLDMEVVCEGVETADQADFLQKIGCGIAQGYLYAKPMPREEFEQMLDQNLGKMK